MRFALACLALAAATPTAATAQTPERCQDWWLDGDSWETKTAGEVADCLAAGADPNARDDRGRTPLGFFLLVLVEIEYSERRGWPGGPAAVVEALLGAGADPNVHSEDGNSLLFQAINDEVGVTTVEALLAAGADPNARNDNGQVPLHLVAFGGADRLASMNALLAAGADPNARTPSGQTPLHMVLWGGSPSVAVMQERVEMLLAAGANPNARSDTGERAADRCAVSPFLSPGQEKEECRALPAGEAPRAAVAPAGPGRCVVPGFPDPPDPESLGFPWCPASVDFQIRVFAISAAGAQCAIATGSSSTPEQIEARNRESADLCGRLDAVAERFGGADCRCPASWR